MFRLDNCGQFLSVALFDFDGTISDRDSFLLFLRYFSGFSFPWHCLCLAPRIILFLLGRYKNHRLKEDFLRRFLAGRCCREVEARAEEFCREIVPAILRREAMEAVRLHQQLGDRLVIVSATPEIVLRPWCRAHGLELIGTRLATERGRLTGAISGRNCRGREKVLRLQKEMDLQKYETIYAYGDSPADLPMLDLAHVACYKPFRNT